MGVKKPEKGRQCERRGITRGRGKRENTKKCNIEKENEIQKGWKQGEWKI